MNLIVNYYKKMIDKKGKFMSEKTLRIFRLCEELARLLGDKEAIADLKILYDRHGQEKDRMFQNMLDVEDIIKKVVENKPDKIINNPKPKGEKDFMAYKKFNERKMGDVGIRNDEGTNIIFHANKRRIDKSIFKDKKETIDGRDAHTPYTQAQSLDGRLVQKNISPIASKGIITQKDLKSQAQTKEAKIQAMKEKTRQAVKENSKQNKDKGFER